MMRVDVPASGIPSWLRSEQIIAAVVLLACAILGYAVYRLGLPGDFLFDDLLRLPSINPESAHPRHLIESTLQNLHGLFGRPVSVSSLALTKATSGAEPGAFKYQNILLHLITGLVQAWAIAYMVGSLPRVNAGNVPGSPRWTVAAFVAGIWLLHPLFVSTVLYSVQRIAILAALFVWTGILCYIAGRRALAFNRPKAAAALLFLGVPISALLGVGSKENAALLPLYLLLINLFTAYPGDGSATVRRIRLFANFALIMMPLVAGFVYLLTHLDGLLAGYEFRSFSLPERLLTQGYLIWWYASLIFLPLVRRLTIYHDSQFLVTPDNILGYFALGSLLALAGIAILLRRRAPLLGFGICLFLASHLMESTIIPLELVFEHRNYVGASGLLLAAYDAIRISLERFRPDRSRGPLVIVTSLALAISTSLLGMQTWTWSDNKKIVLLAVQEHPDSRRAHIEAANISLREGDIRQAPSFLQRAIKIDPTEAGAYLHLYILKCEGILNKKQERAIRTAASRGRITPYASDAFQKIAALAKNRKCQNISPDDALDLIEIGLANPTLRDRYRYNIHLSAADLLIAEKRYQDALDFLEAAFPLADKVPLNARHRVLVLDITASLSAGEFERAFSKLEQLRELARHPYFRVAYPELADNLTKHARDITDWQEKRTLDP